MSYGLPLPPFAGSCTPLSHHLKMALSMQILSANLLIFRSKWHGRVGAGGDNWRVANLSHKEHDLVVELCIKQAAGACRSLLVLVNSTAEAVRLAACGGGWCRAVLMSALL